MSSNSPCNMGRFPKNIMMEAYIEAGLVNEKIDISLFFSLEPEATSL